jgi:hypothetical protein
MLAIRRPESGMPGLWRRFVNPPPGGNWRDPDSRSFRYETGSSGERAGGCASGSHCRKRAAGWSGCSSAEGCHTKWCPADYWISCRQRPTLLFVFSTECSICRANWPWSETVAKAIDKRRDRIVYANLSELLTPSYLAEHHLSEATVLARVDPSSVLSYGLGMTPLLLLIDQNARIPKVWIGRLKDSQVTEIRQARGGWLS